MLTFREMATFLNAAAARVKPQLKAETDDLLADAEKEAKALIGQEHGGWKPLSSATLEGFWHPAGFRVKGKRELGFTGKVSPTDPLLRTGGMRASIEHESEITASGAEGAVGSPEKVALWQEIGTPDARYPIPPRPYFATGMMKAEGGAPKRFGVLAMKLLTPGPR